jgi:hypothetical protein
VKSFWDRKALGAFRVGLGLYLVGYTILCLSSGTAMFTDQGVLPIHVLAGLSVEKGYGSLYLASRWWAWAYFLLFGQLLLSLCFTIGFRVRLLAVPLAYLLWSLNARNPLVVGLAEEWIVVMVLAASLLPVCEAYAVEDAPPWFQTSKALQQALHLAGLFLLLSLPAAWMTEQLFTHPESSWTWLGMAALAGLLLQSRARNLAVVLFGSWCLAVWYPGPLLLLGGLVGVALLRLDSRGEDSLENLVWLPFLLAVLLQLHWLAYQAGLAKTAFPQKIVRQKILAGSSYLEIGFSPKLEAGRAVKLFPRLDDRSILMRRYLNRLHAAPNPKLFPFLMTFYIDKTDNLKVGESKTYTIFLHAPANPGGRFRTQTVPKNSDIWERMPALDRNPLQ